MSHQAARTSLCTPMGTRPANATSSFELVAPPIARRRSLSQGDVPMIALPRSLATLVVALALIVAGALPARAAVYRGKLWSQSTGGVLRNRLVLHFVEVYPDDGSS